MRTIKNFGLMALAMAAMMVVASCGKDFQDDIDDLNFVFEMLCERAHSSQISGHVYGLACRDTLWCRRNPLFCNPVVRTQNHDSLFGKEIV